MGYGEERNNAQAYFETLLRNNRPPILVWIQSIRNDSLQEDFATKSLKTAFYLQVKSLISKLLKILAILKLLPRLAPPGPPALSFWCFRCSLLPWRQKQLQKPRSSSTYLQVLSGMVRRFSSMKISTEGS